MGLTVRELEGALEVAHPTGPLLRYSVDPRYRPHVHPLFAPGTDRPLTRVRPVDHPWQYGAWVGLNDVNGQDFWCCGDAYYPVEARGSIRNVELHAEQSPHGVTVHALNEWLDVSCNLLATERQAWVVAPPDDSSYTVDVTWELRALDTPLHVGAHDYGGLTVRLVGEPATERLLDSEGRRDGDCGDGARWVSRAQPVDGVGTYVRDAADPLSYAYAGVAVFAEAPASWRLSGGLLNPSPQREGAIDLPARGSTAYRNRLIVFLGSGDEGRLHEAYAEWTA